MGQTKHALETKLKGHKKNQLSLIVKLKKKLDNRKYNVSTHFWGFIRYYFNLKMGGKRGEGHVLYF